MQIPKVLIEKIAKDISLLGGTAYYVGGYVRDLFLNKESKDIDVEIHGITPLELKKILSKYGEVDEVGASFGVLIIKGVDIDFAMPRVERKTGEGHKGFDIEIDSFMGVEKACLRRDFTINSIYKNVLDDEIIDCFNGIQDIQNGIIRHVDKNSFIEDPLRVFRACQFASRFNFTINEDTMKLCTQINTDSLAKERVYTELKKAILKSKEPSVFFNKLKEMNKLALFFKELDNLDEVVFCKLMNQIDSLEDKTIENVFSLMGLYVSDIKSLMSYVTNETKLIKLVEENVKVLKLTNTHLSDSYMREIAYLSIKNAQSIKILLKAIYGIEYSYDFNLRFEEALNVMKQPLITSTDLILNGIEPGKEFGLLLRQSINLQIEGRSKSEIEKLLFKKR